MKIFTMQKTALSVAPVVLVARGAEAASMPPPIADSAAEPVRYLGQEQTDKRFCDGALRHAVGVHKYQALPANRTCPPEGGAFGSICRPVRYD